MNVLGVKIVGHDTGAALISNGRIVAIAEERLNRVKHSPYMFPELAIDYCLEAFGVSAPEIDLIVLDQIFLKERYPMRELFAARMGKRFPNAKIRVINHHDAHAAAAFFCSPFDEAAILIHDGVGEAFRSPLGVVVGEAETLYYGSGNRFSQIQKTVHLWKGKKYYHTCPSAKPYSLISGRYLGFGRYNEGKLMGLAPYGTDAVLRQFPLSHWYREFKGHTYCNPRIVFPGVPVSVVVPVTDPSTLLQRLARFLRKRVRKLLRPALEHLMVSFMPERLVASKPFFPEIRLTRPPRDSSVKLPDEYYSSVAYAAQFIVEQVAIIAARKLKRITRSANICIAGGVGLNIDANKKILDSAGFEHIFIQPGASDTGIPLGCALWGHHVILGQPRFWTMRSASLGRPYSEEEIVAAAKKHGGVIMMKKLKDIIAETARFIADGKIVGWFQGGSEYGPRALGNRSILCDARRPDMKDTLNNRVKHREPWRPFAASVLLERMPEYFEISERSPFMLLMAKVRDEKRQEIPSVVHVDGTCRLQSVTKEANGRYYDLIAKFFELTGTPLILNTSFNLGGEPIVETPGDALTCFLKTKMDIVVIGDYIITKCGTPEGSIAAVSA